MKAKTVNENLDFKRDLSDRQARKSAYDFIRGKNPKSAMELGEYRWIPADEFDMYKAEPTFYLAKSTGMYSVFSLEDPTHGMDYSFWCASPEAALKADLANNDLKKHFIDNFGVMEIKKLENYGGPLTTPSWDREY